MAFDAEVATRLSPWIAGQQVALGAALLVALKTTSVRDENLVFENRVWPDSRPPSRTDYGSYRQRLQDLPPAALQLIKSLPNSSLNYWGDHQPHWKEAFDQLAWDGQRSALAGAKLLADRILDGHQTSHQIARLARLELGAEWTATDPLHEALESIRAARLKPSRLRHLLSASPRPPRWALVESALLQRTHAWPLLVLEKNEAIACALPMEIEVKLGLGDPEEDGAVEANPVELITGPNILCDEWRESAERALRAAKDLWLKKRGGIPFAFQRAVRNASVKLDLTAASLIAAPYVKRFGKFRFHGGSLEVLLALEFLARFLGLPGLGATTATGKLGARRPNGKGPDRHRKGADHEIEYVTDFVSAKIDCARRMFFFDKIIVPYGTAAEGYVGHLNVLAGHLFSDFADAAFGQLWRRHRYVRSPDLSFDFKAFKEDGFDAQALAEINGVREEITRSKSAILWLDGVPALTVAQALCQVNDAATGDDTPEFKERFEKNERQGSFAFLRVAPGERPDTFWRTFWDIMGGSDDSFRDFAFTVSAPHAAAVLGEELTRRLYPTPQEPKRAPDAIVVIGARNLVPGDGLAASPFSRLQPSSIFCELRAAEHRQRYIPSTTNPVLRKHLGRTRVILVDEAIADEFAADNLVPETLRSAFRNLSTFRHGFDFEAARAVLGISETDCACTLRDLRDVLLDGRPLLAYAASAGEFFLRARTAPPTEPQAASELHARAANALVGFLKPDPRVARFDYGAALRPDRLNDALWQLEQAAIYARRAGAPDGGSFVAMERLVRLGERFGWAQLLRAERLSNEAGEDLWWTLQQHLDAWPSRNLLHPLELAIAAKFARKLELRKRSAGACPDSLKYFSAAKWTLLSRAEGLCSRFPPHEAEAARFVVSTTRAAFVLSDDPTRRGLEKCRRDTSIAFERLARSRGILSSDWYLFMGDAEGVHESAADLYRRAFDAIATASAWRPQTLGLQPFELEAVGKFVGACLLARTTVDPRIVGMVRDQFVPRDWRRVQATPVAAAGLKDAPHAQSRWHVGRSWLLERK